MSQDPTVLVIDRNRNNLTLLSQYLQQEGYRSMTADNLKALDRTLAAEPEIDLALVGLAGFDRSIWSRCEQLRGRGVPFVVISPQQNAAIQQESLTHGARGVLSKPLVVQELFALLRSLVEDDT